MMTIPHKKLKTKKYNYRNKQKIMYQIIIYFFCTGYRAKNKSELRVPFFNKKFNLLISAQISNGHIGINITADKIKEKGYFWETLRDDVKEFIGNCPKCIFVKKGKYISQKILQIINKDPLKLVVIDGWELDIDIKNITRFTHIIDIIDHFYKYNQHIN